MWFDIALIVALCFVIFKLHDIFTSVCAVDRSVTELVKSANQLIHLATKWSPQPALDKSADETASFTPFIALVETSANEANEWSIVNHGHGPAVNVCYVYPSHPFFGLDLGEAEEKNVQSLLGLDEKKVQRLTTLLAVGQRSLLDSGITNEICSSIERIAAVSAKVRNLAAEGYKYKDLYGEPNVEFEFVLEYESLRGKRYRTLTTWSPEGMRTKFEVCS